MEQNNIQKTENIKQKQLPQLYIVDKKKKKKHRIFIKSYFIFIVLVVLILIELFRSGSYFDEVLALVSVAYLIIFNKKINKYDIITFSILIVISILGFISNWYSGVKVGTFSILVDAITQIKTLSIFFFTKYFLNNEEKQTTIEMFVPIAKIFSVIAFFFAVLSQFVNTGMTTEVRYGLKCFNFIFVFNFQYIATFLLLLGSIVCSQKMSQKQKHIYYFISVTAILLNLKSQALIFGFLFILLCFMMKRFKRLNLLTLIIMMAGVYFLSQYQIDTYLSKEGTARHVFYEYAVKNANTYFPFGSGFATYGSSEAAKNYSPLYYLYGFDEVWGMSPDFRAFLNDTYWACVLGQIGWIGIVLMVFVYFRVFRSMTSHNFSIEQRAFLYAAFAQYVVHAIGAGIITSSPGVIGFMAMALFIPYDESMNKGVLLSKIRISF